MVRPIGQAAKPQFTPLVEGIMLPLIEKQMREDRDEEGPRPTATGSRLRASYALSCARQIGFQVLGIPEDSEVPFETLMAFGVGQRFHDSLQDIAIKQLGATIEVVADYGDAYEMSGHADLLYQQKLYSPGVDEAEWPDVNVIGEIKSISGYGFLICTGGKKDPAGLGAGPKSEHVCQAAIVANAPNIMAQKLHMIYVDKDKGTIAEWFLDMDTQYPRYENMTPRQLAENELSRQTGILGRIDEQMIPARHIPGHGRVGHVPDPNSKDQPWNCRYCRFNGTCAILPSTPTPLSVIEHLLPTEDEEDDSPSED